MKQKQETKSLHQIIQSVPTVKKVISNHLSFILKYTAVPIVAKKLHHTKNLHISDQLGTQNLVGNRGKYSGKNRLLHREHFFFRSPKNATLKDSNG